MDNHTRLHWSIAALAVACALVTYHLSVVGAMVANVTSCELRCTQDKLDANQARLDDIRENCDLESP